jgi:hypothetical protein
MRRKRLNNEKIIVDDDDDDDIISTSFHYFFSLCCVLYHKILGASMHVNPDTRANENIPKVSATIPDESIKLHLWLW